MYWFLVPAILTMVVTLLAYRQQKKETFVSLPYQAVGIIYGMFFFAASFGIWLVLFIINHLSVSINFR